MKTRKGKTMNFNSFKKVSRRSSPHVQKPGLWVKLRKNYTMIGLSQELTGQLLDQGMTTVTWYYDEKHRYLALQPHDQVTLDGYKIAGRTRSKQVAVPKEIKRLIKDWAEDNKVYDVFFNGELYIIDLSREGQ